MDIDQKLKELEVEFGVAKGKEPTNYEEFIEQYPDYEELNKYYSDVLHNAIEEKKKQYGEGYWSKAVVEAGKALEEEPRYLNDRRLQKAEKCQKYYCKLCPEGIREGEMLGKYLKPFLP